MKQPSQHLPGRAIAPSSWVAFILAAQLLGGGTFAATVPFQEGFEGYPDGTTLNTLTNQGWGASSNTVVVRTVSTVPDSVRGTNAVAVPEGMIASNVATSVAFSNVWVDLYVPTNMGMPASLAGEESVDTNMTVEVFLDTNGCPVVWNPASNAWIVCSQDAWQTNVSVFNTAQWARITLCQNYSNKTATLFMNGHMILTGLPFIDTNRTSYGLFQAEAGVAMTSYVDEVSVAYSPPAAMEDVDDDGMPEAEEIQWYGNTTTRSWRTVTVSPTNHGTITPFTPFSIRPGGQTNFVLTADPGYYVADALTNGQSVGTFPGQYTNSVATYTWSNILPDGLVNGTFGAVFQQQPQVSLAALVNGTAALSATEVFPGGEVTCSMTGLVAYGVASVLTNGSLAASFAGTPRTDSYVLANIWTNTTLTVNFGYTGRRLVPADYATLQDAVNAAQTGDTIMVSAGSYANPVTFDKTLTFNGTNVILQGGVTVASGNALVVSNGSVDVGTLTVQAGGTVQVVNATAFIVNGSTFTGTFTWVAGWETTVVPQTPPYADSFERYAPGTIMNLMGYYGWEAPSTNVVAQDTLAQSNRAVEIPARALLSSAMGASAVSNIWVELYYRDTNRTPVELVTLDVVDTNLAVEAFINTNGFVTVFDPVPGQWVVCSNDARGVPVAALPLQAWARITVNENYARGRAAVFLNGRLLRQELRFINTNVVSSGRFEVESGYVGPTYLDTYSVRTNSIGIVSDDADNDGWPDAWEIDQFGNTAQTAVSGVVFKFK
jgi:hypothetical protein